MFRVISRDHALSLVDQAIVSGTSFLTTVSVARWSGSSQLGIYAVGVSILLSLLAFQDSLILQPYSIQRFDREGTPAEAAGASLTLNFLFGAASALVLIIAAAAFLASGARREMIAMTWTIAGITPFALTRDFARRYSFAHLKMVQAVFIDAAAAVIQLSGLVLLQLDGALSAVTACIVLGVASAVPVAFFLYLSRAEFSIHARHVYLALKQTWALGKWLLVGRIIVQVQGYVTYWISIAIAGAAVTGAYAACMSIVGFVNPLMIGLANVLIPKSVLAWKDAGARGLLNDVVRNTALIALLMGSASLAVLVMGEPIMRVLYDGTEFQSLGHVLTVLVVAMSAGALGLPASNALAVIERPGAIVRATTVGSVLTVVLVWFLIREFGLLGAAYGALAGGIAGAIARWVAFLACLPRARDPKSIERALLDTLGRPNDAEHSITRVGEGEDAEVFMIDWAGRQASRDAYGTLAAKVYKAQAALDADMVRAQFDSLLLLHEALHGQNFGGWNIFVPRPLHICTSPLAVIMTAVPGKSIDFYASGNGPDSLDVLFDAADAFAKAMQRYWSGGHRHGDLALNNVLFNFEAKQISFIDPGTVESCKTCNGTGQYPSDAASDLGHMIYDAAVNVADFVGNQKRRVYREAFIDRVLRMVIDGLASSREKERLLQEILMAAQQHVADYLEPSWSLRGVRNRFVRQIAISRIQASLNQNPCFDPPTADQDEHSASRSIGAG